MSKLKFSYGGGAWQGEDRSTSGIGFHQAQAAASVVNRAELSLLLVTACILLFVIGMWLRNVAVGSAPPTMVTVTVRPGDTLWKLAGEYGDPDRYILERVSALAKANGLEKNRMLREGQTLAIPVSSSAKLYYGGKYASRRIAD